MNPGLPSSPTLPDNNEIPVSDLEADPIPQSAFTHRMATPVLKYLEGRGLLLGIEMREALQQVVKVIIWLAVGAISAFAGWIVLVTSLIGALSSSFDWSWIKVSAVIGGVHFLITIAAALLTWNRLTTARWFADSFNELKKDRAWLKTQTSKN